MSWLISYVFTEKLRKEGPPTGQYRCFSTKNGKEKVHGNGRICVGRRVDL